MRLHRKAKEATARVKGEHNYYEHGERENQMKGSGIIGLGFLLFITDYTSGM